MLVAAQPHGPGPAAHFVLFAGVVAVALVVLGVNRWRARRDAKTSEPESEQGAEATRAQDEP